MAHTATEVPLYVSFCLKCKKSNATPHWPDVGPWMIGHLGQGPDHSVVTSRTTISTDFVTATSSQADGVVYNQPVTDAVVYEQTGGHRG